MRVLKVGRRIGSLNKHAVIYYRGKLKMASLESTGKWLVFMEGDFCPEMKRHFLNQIF